MNVARPSILKKGRILTSSLVKNTSCSGGWLRMLLQGVFATITTASFILIVMMAVKNPKPSPVTRPMVPPRCKIHGCRVICKEAPYYEEYEDDIISTVSDADQQCQSVTLELNEPHFVNNTLPVNWLWGMRYNIYHLEIIGGNLEHVPSGAFMSQFSVFINILILQDIHILSWHSTSLVGLSRLRTLNILNSIIDSFHDDALKAVDDTLETLTITKSGEWDPANFTGFVGFTKLIIVDFSHNDFNEILSRHSFVGLEVTKILYLNSCRITAIGAGAFDYLLSIDVLYLNNNMLVTIPPGLFNNIAALHNPRPRINLQDNFWLCDCEDNDLRHLITNDLLLVEVTCTYPEAMNSKTFSQFEYSCNNETDVNLFDDANVSDTTNMTNNIFHPDHYYVNGRYCSRRRRGSFGLISPVRNNKCLAKNFQSLNTILDAVHDINKKIFDNGSRWLRFSYFFKTNTYSVVQIGAKEQQEGYGLLWYQSTCPHEVYCLNVMPIFLRVYNIDTDASYTFCPFLVNSSTIEEENCIVYDFSDEDIDAKSVGIKEERAFYVILYITTSFLCLVFGAVVVYALIRMKPTLLRGSKRIVFVKHKNVDALVLPPKLPLRNDLKADTIDFKNKDIFTLSTDHKLKPPNLNRIKSIRSDRSGTPSYISAMQPTEDQLAEWRIRHHFDNDLTIKSGSSQLSALSWICGDSYYCSLEEDKTYESLK